LKILVNVGILVFLMWNVDSCDYCGDYLTVTFKGRCLGRLLSTGGIHYDQSPVEVW